MLYKIKDKLNRYLFSKACHQIYNSPPLLTASDQPVAVLTQLQHKDVLMFLIAVKSFAKQVPLQKVIIINDGSLTQEDFETLKKHVPISDIYEACDFSDKSCPTGGCWERLLAIAYFSETYYVIQLDSDTLTISELNEVYQCIDTSTGFVIGTWDNQIIESMQICSLRVQNNVGKSLQGHVQMVAEAYFSDLDNCSELNYVRGCAGFAGFPKNGFKKEFIIDFSTQIETLIGSKWREWGSEQVMSNVVVANLEKAQVLPHPKYCDCNNIKHPETSFIHFIGDCRFKSDLYSKLASKAITKLIT